MTGHFVARRVGRKQGLQRLVSELKKRGVQNSSEDWFGHVWTFWVKLIYVYIEIRAQRTRAAIPCKAC